MRVYSRYERKYSKIDKKKKLEINFRKYLLFLFGIAIVFILLDFGIRKIDFFKVKKVDINKLDYIKPELLSHIYSSYIGKFPDKKMISELSFKLDSTGLFSNIKVSRTLLFNLSIDIKEYELLGVVNYNGNPYYLNENGKLISDTLLDTLLILPEVRDLIIDSMRVLNKYNIDLCKKYIKYIKNNLGNIYSKIKFIKFDKDNEIIFVLDNGKLLELSKYTNIETIKQLGFIFDYLYLDNSFNLIDLKYNNQIITKQI